MKQKNLSLFSMITLFFLLFLVVASGVYAIHQRTNTLKDAKYQEITREMRDELQTLITEKKDAMLLIAHTLAQDATLHQALKEQKSSNIDMGHFVSTLINDTSISHIQFHIVDAQAKSFYRSWTDKKGDDLSNVRIDVLEMIKKKKASSIISVGMYDITFKAMVPIFYEGQFIGIVEAISKTNSIVSKMKERGYDTIVLVDKSYKKQLIYPFTNHFIQEYYVATPNIKPSHKDFLIQKGLDALLNSKHFIVAKDANLLTTTYQVPDVLGNPMAYIAIFIPLDSIDFSAIMRDRNFIMLIFFMIFVILGALFFYLYIKRHNKLIQKMNAKLEVKVAEKTASLQYLAHHDTLTSLPNRLLFIDRLEQSILHAKHQKIGLNVLFLDLDRFKEINDSFGHEAGDQLLKAISKRLRQCVREEDTVARLGGDEFTILLADMDANSVTQVLKEILFSMQEPIILNDTPLYTTFSIGISRYPQDGKSPDILIRNADTAMYRAKELGKNRYQFYDEQMTYKTMQRLNLENKLRKALQENHLEPYFQIQIDAFSNKMIGAEALVRWKDPEVGIISPAEFIPLAEEIGLISLIDEWMMQKSFEIIKKLQTQKLFEGKLSLNLSVKQLERKNFLQKLHKFLEQNDFNPRDLELEVTESQIMQNPEAAISALRSIQNMGISIAIDDFGTGYSSLSYLKRLPIDKLKIDKSFVDDLPTDTEDVAIVKAIIALARSLNINLIAEGVETQEQKSFLLESGCHYIQGYLYSKPLDAKAFEKYLRERKL
jgi:diguanylate cyclase (GGDEF)-like protein